MPVRFELEHGERRYGIVTVVDPYTFDEWGAALRGLASTPEFQQRRAVLVDRRGAAPPTTEFVTAMIATFAQYRQILGAARVAVVVSDDTAFGMARMTELRAAFTNPEGTIRPFRALEDAVRWLTGARTIQAT